MVIHDSWETPVFHEGFDLELSGTTTYCEGWWGHASRGETNTSLIQDGSTCQPVGGVFELIVVPANHKVNGYFIVCCPKWVEKCDEVPSKTD